MSDSKTVTYSLDNRISDIHNNGLDVTQRIVYLTSVEEHPDEEVNDPGIEFRQSSRFIKNINILSSLDPEKPVLVVLKSPGGFVEEGYAIYDAILATPMPVTIVGYSCIASMASVIFQAANKRVLMPSSSLMFHMGNMGVHGTPKLVDSTLNYDKMWLEHTLDIYVDVMKTAPHGKARNWSRKRIREWLEEQMNHKEDVYLTAEEAVHWGFADSVFEDWPSLFEYTEEELAR